MINYDQIIEDLKQQDEKAFEYLYNETKNAVYSMIVSIVKDKAASQDIMQETYLIMLKKLDQYQKGRNFINWLVIIARNQAIDYYRRRKKEILVDIDDETVFPYTQPMGERSVLFNEMLINLNQIERSIFLLRIVNNFKNREISKILNIPLGTVLWHYSKAIKKIKKIKGGEGNETK